MTSLPEVMMNCSPLLAPTPGHVVAGAAAAYLGAQLLVGVELGILSAWLVVAREVPLFVALGATLPAGLPLVIAHTALLGIAAAHLAEAVSGSPT